MIKIFFYNIKNIMLENIFENDVTYYPISKLFPNSYKN